MSQMIFAPLALRWQGSFPNPGGSSFWQTRRPTKQSIVLATPRSSIRKLTAFKVHGNCYIRICRLWKLLYTNPAISSIKILDAAKTVAASILRTSSTKVLAGCTDPDRSRLRHRHRHRLPVGLLAKQGLAWQTETARAYRESVTEGGRVVPSHPQNLQRPFSARPAKNLRWTPPFAFADWDTSARAASLLSTANSPRNGFRPHTRHLPPQFTWSDWD